MVSRSNMDEDMNDYNAIDYDHDYSVDDCENHSAVEYYNTSATSDTNDTSDDMQDYFGKDF